MKSGLGRTPFPDRRIRESQLEFAAVLTEEKRKVLAAKKAEIRGKDVTNGRERIFRPTRRGGELLRPRVGGGKKHQATRSNQRRQNLLKKPFRVFHPVHEIGREHQVKFPKGRQLEGIGCPKTEPCSVFRFGCLGRGHLSPSSLQFQGETDGFFFLQGAGSPNESFGEINAHHLGNFPGQFKRRPTHRTPQIQGAERLESLTLGFRQKQGCTSRGKVLDSERCAIAPG